MVRATDIKVEFTCGARKRVDIACFRRPCKSNNREELKKKNALQSLRQRRFSAGLDYAHEQAKTYSKDFPNCQAVITTNGYCYKVYLRDQCDKFQEMPSAYINLLRPRDKYPLDPNSKVKGALEAIKWLLPSNLITTPKEPGTLISVAMRCNMSRWSSVSGMPLCSRVCSRCHSKLPGTSALASPGMGFSDRLSRKMRASSAL